MNTLIINGGGAGGSCTTACHGAASPTTCDLGVVSQIGWLDTTNATERYDSVVSCSAEILNMIGTSPAGIRMPQGGPYFTTAEIALFNQWRTDGHVRSARPTVTTTTMTGPFFNNDSATLRGTVDLNGSAAVASGTYFQWGTNSGLAGASNLIISNPSGSGGSSVAVDISGGISGLLCGTPYYFRARVQNGQGLSTNSTIRSFTTDACSNPMISYSGQGATTGTRVGVPKLQTFDETDIAPISAMDVDTGSLSWSINQAGTSGSVVLDNAFPLQFTYTAPATSGIDQFVLIVTDTDPAGGGGPNTASVTVYVNVTDSPPQFLDMPGGSVITGDSFSVSEGNGSAPSFTLNMYATDPDPTDTINWSIAPGGAPANGSLSGPSSATGTSSSVTYTPNNNVDFTDSPPPTFVVRITDGTTNVDLDVVANLIPVPDSPTAGDDGPVTFDIGVPVTISVLANDNDVDTGDNIFVDPLSISTSPGNTAIAVNGNTQIRYTSSGSQFTDDTFQYRVIDTTARTSNPATVTMRPRDSDGDGVIDYLDNCAGTMNPGQTDTDGDQVINVNTTADPGGDIGGDACDDDDDGDMISDADEIANSLDPLDPNDATLDNDGDGINNRDEINAGTNPNSPNLTIDATGYYTPFKLPTPDPRAFHNSATALTASDYGPYRPGDNTIFWTPSNSVFADLSVAPHLGGLVSNPPEQPFFVRPLLNFAADQVAEEGGTVNVTLSLNGEAPSYPVTVSYSISGSASAADYSTPMPASGAVVFNDTTPQTISFTLTAADGSDAGETIVFSLTGATNAALGAKRSHTVTIIEGNVAPQAALQFDQGADTVVSAVAGPVNITVVPSDVNAGQTHTFDWSGTDNFLTPPAGGATLIDSWPTPALTPGNYVVEVRVTDDGSPSRSVTARRILNVIAAAPALAAVDTDGDTVNDDLEGFDDSDGDGIPNYLDAFDNDGAHLLADQTADIGDSFLLETEAGLRLVTGGTAQASASYGAMITDTEIEDFGAPAGGASRFSDDGITHFGGVYDFRVSGLVPGSSARIVIPLQTSIPKDAEFRKYDPARGWGRFVEDDDNALSSARGAPGACPEPGSDRYRDGLNYLDNCLQLLVEDGGPNDNDHAVNGEVADPGTLGARLTDPEIEEVEDGGGQMSLWLMTLLALLGLLPGLRRGTVQRE